MDALHKLKVGQEEQIEIELCRWFQQHNIPCYYNRKISSLQNLNFFKVIGSRKRPDLLIQSSTYPFNGYIAIEVKNANTSRNVYDSNKIIDYLAEYQDGKATYHICDKQVNISVFAIANQFSKLGKLYDETELLQPDVDWLKAATEYKTVPPIEFTRTKQHIRQMWAEFRRLRNKGAQYNRNPGLGAILSGLLNKDLPDNHLMQPYIFCMFKKRNLATGKELWGQQWKSL